MKPRLEISGSNDLKTAKAIGLTLPQSVPIRTDQLIE
jgi:hypothetical protein